MIAVAVLFDEGEQAQRLGMGSYRCVVTAVHVFDNRVGAWHVLPGQATLDASMEEACLAVRLYNDPAENRSFEGFVVHMHLAWLYLMYGEFIRDGIDYRYWDTRYKRRLLKVDGEPKLWELQSCLRALDGRNDVVRADLSLFIRLRNRLEHRHAHADAALMVTLFGHAHSLLLNYEHELTNQFGMTNRSPCDFASRLSSAHLAVCQWTG